MGYVILILVMAFLYCGVKGARALLTALINLVIQGAIDAGSRQRNNVSASRAVGNAFEPDVLCQYCPSHFHDGGKRCIKCGNWTRSTGYLICHGCTGTGVLPKCESCGRFF